MVNVVSSILLAAASLLAQPSAPEATPQLDAAAVTAVRDALAPITAQLNEAASGKPEAREALTRSATDPLAASQLDAWITAAKGLSGVELVGFEVQATLWFGIVPLRQVELYLWFGKDGGARVLRMNPGERDLPLFGVMDHRWTGEAGKGVETLVTEVLESVEAGRCEAIPVVTREDYAAALPQGEKASRETMAYLDRFRNQVGTSCQQLSGTPFNQVTWRVTDIGGVLRTELARGASRSFRMLVEQRDDGSLGLERISPPVAPRR